MHIRVLGAAAGGGFPQWNCSCTNCLRLRQGRFHGQPRTQAQLAVSTDDASWYLLNASPDLRFQIESFPPLHPQAACLRHSPIAGIVLPSAEVDAALGLLLLRESQPLTVYATSAVRQILTDDNSLFQVLRRQRNQVKWISMMPDVPFALQDSGLECLPVSTDGGFPGFVPEGRRKELDPREAVLGVFLQHQGHRVAVFSGASRVCPDWLEEFNRCDVVFFDGTFWSDDELIQLQGSGKTAREMGHQPVQETVRALAKITARKIFIHINNSNPILDEDSEEFRMTRDAGWEVAFDGMDLVV
ncbi:MAG: pyrroloquinoline quinone biosynthesis protein PqqB [Acidobacteriaceae bacterium]|nr:pyrroloquinoline quinone biosynthesis protein PqqB [Acidobacteriaceae bacterium]MBV8572914.1 pyrroloquinoline quinone biosynthesis protein PqqB [Acidobacteriaceae bacterium]